MATSDAELGVFADRKEEEDRLFPVQRKQVAWVIMAFPDIFVDKPVQAGGCEYRIMPPWEGGQNPFMLGLLSPVGCFELGSQSTAFLRGDRRLP